MIEPDELEPPPRSAEAEAMRRRIAARLFGVAAGPARTSHREDRGRTRVRRGAWWAALAALVLALAALC